MHNVYFVQYDAPVSKMPLDITCIFVYMIQGHIKGEITDLEFDNYKNVKTCISRTLGQIYVQGYKNSIFRCASIS